MGKESKYWARRPFGYGGMELDRGQVVSLAGAKNDEKLVRLGYLAKCEKGGELHSCSECGTEFVGVAERTAHGEKRHRSVVLTPDQEDSRAEREERLMEEIAPLAVG